MSAKAKDDFRALTLSNGETIEIPRSLEISSIQKHTQAHGDGSGKQEHHRSTVTFSDGTKYLVKETSEQIHAA